MFQLERLNVVKETLKQILGEMRDNRIETTDGMIPTAQDISTLANLIPEIVNEEKKRREEAWKDEDC